MARLGREASRASLSSTRGKRTWSISEIPAYTFERPIKGWLRHTHGGATSALSWRVSLDETATERGRVADKDAAFVEFEPRCRISGIPGCFCQADAADTARRRPRQRDDKRQNQ